MITESLILAQDERWRHGLGMQVERDTIFRDSEEWRMGEYHVGNLPLSGGQLRETWANTACE